MLQQQLSLRIDEILPKFSNAKLGDVLEDIKSFYIAVGNFNRGKISKEEIKKYLVKANAAYDKLYNLRIYPEINIKFLQKIDDLINIIQDYVNFNENTFSGESTRIAKDILKVCQKIEKKYVN